MSSKNKLPHTITKLDLVKQVYSKLGFSKKESSDLVELFFKSIKQHLKMGKSIKISGFGRFNVRKKKERIGRNPQTGETMKISARKVLTFKPSQVIKSLINKKSKH